MVIRDKALLGVTIRDKTCSAVKIGQIKRTLKKGYNRDRDVKLNEA
jgi:hypothetical protein